MGKRKRSKDSDYENMRKKVKKLKHELARLRKRSSSSSSGESSGEESIPDIPSYYESDVPDEEFENESIPLEVDNGQPETSTPAVEEVQPSVTLDPEILQLLGEDPANQKSYGDDIHKDIAPRWIHILTNGMSKDTKSDIMKLYLPSENCPNMKAPKLNLEIKAALSELNLKKDLYSQNKQSQITSCLAAVGKVLNWALSTNNSVPQEIIKPLIDTGRLLCDCHYRESQSRRFAIANTLNKQTKDIIKNTKLDDFLFGSNLSEHLKSSKAITKSGAEMKSTISKPPFKPSNTQPQRGALNSRGMSRAVAGEPRQNPTPRRPAAASGNRRQEATSGYRRTSSYSRQRTRRR